MNKKEELLELIKFLSEGTSKFEAIRTGGNLGTAIAGFQISEGLKQIAWSIENLNKTIKEVNKPIVTGQGSPIEIKV